MIKAARHSEPRTPAYLIRGYQKQDSTAIANIFRSAIFAIDSSIYHEEEKAAWAGDKSVDFWRQRLAQTQPYVAVQADVVIGFIELLRRDADTAYIDCCYVVPTHQGLGVGGALIRHALHQARIWHIRHIDVHASDVARPIFSHFGFECIERQHHGPDNISLANTLMKLTLF